MCGICGEIHYGNGAPADGLLIRRMAAALAHRGPDDEGYFLDGSVGLGQRRLAIIDPAGGHQPLANEDETVWITYNGTIYNSPALRDALEQRGHRFRTRTDTEVIVHAYEEYGLEALARLNGMYAFALWDGRARRLVLARDPFGIKPLYIRDDGRRLQFASELKAFLADPTFPRALDLSALDDYLTFGFVPSPRTMFAGVSKLQPGHCLIVTTRGVRTIAFAPRAPEPAPPGDERSATVELQERLVTAVAGQMLSDVPVGALLSGGIDSAAVTALAREVTGQTLQTFTVGFEGRFAHDELAAARRSAALLGTAHRDVVIGAHHCLEVIADAIWHLDEPVATPSFLAMYWLSRLAAEHVKVVLTGQGADEPWAGYPRYRGERVGRWYRQIPRAVRRGLIEPLATGLRSERLRRAADALGVDDPIERFARAFAVFTPAIKRALYRDDIAAALPARDPLEVLRYWQQPVAHLDPLRQQLHVETRVALADNLLLYGDKMSMAFSLEARVPLLDQQVMRFVENLPIELRLKGWAGHKHLYRKAVRRWLPDEIMRRPKIGFVTPMAAWLRGPLASVVRERIGSAGSAGARYFDDTFSTHLVEQHLSGRADRSRALFSLLVFEYWHERFMAPPAADLSAAS